MRQSLLTTASLFVLCLSAPLAGAQTKTNGCPPDMICYPLPATRALSGDAYGDALSAAAQARAAASAIATGTSIAPGTPTMGNTASAAPSAGAPSTPGTGTTPANPGS